MYAFILLLGTIIACVMLSPGVEQQLKRIPGFCHGGAGSGTPGIEADVQCEIFVGYKAAMVAVSVGAFYIPEVPFTQTLLSVTGVNYILSFTAAVLCYNIYAQPEGCMLNKFFICFNMLLCVIASALSVLPRIQEYQPRSGLLQSSIMTLYTMYLTWSAMTNEP
ncbi:hypothetical protein cypCar_00046737, partial [Cyprinus carpio]